MAKSKIAKKFTNMIYGLGAAVVIIGALFKLQHYSIGPLTGGVMLTIGLLVEAAIFVYSAFEPVEEELDWTRVYPELADISLSGSARKPGASENLTQKLDVMMQDANINSNLIESLGNGLRNLKGATESISDVSQSLSASKDYNQQMLAAAKQMQTLNDLYKVQVDNAQKYADFNSSMVENSAKLKEQMESLANNLSTLNTVYGGMLSAMNKK